MDRTNSCVAAVYCHRGDKQPSLRCSSLFGDSLVSFSPKQHHSTHRSSGGSLQFPPRALLASCVREMLSRPTILLPALVVFDLDFTLVRG